MRLYRAVDKI